MVTDTADRVPASCVPQEDSPISPSIIMQRYASIIAAGRMYTAIDITS